MSVDRTSMCPQIQVTTCMLLRAIFGLNFKSYFSLLMLWQQHISTLRAIKRSFLMCILVQFLASCSFWWSLPESPWRSRFSLPSAHVSVDGCLSCVLQGLSRCRSWNRDISPSFLPFLRTFNSMKSSYKVQGPFFKTFSKYCTRF